MKFKIGDLVKVKRAAWRPPWRARNKIGYVIDIDKAALAASASNPLYHIQLFDFAEPACLYESEIELA
jgi:hypothetical protein